MARYRSQKEDLNNMDPAAFDAQIGTKLDQLITLANALRSFVIGDRLVAGDPALARGSTDRNVASGLIYYQIGGAFLTKAAVAAGTALAAGTIPQDKWGVYLFSIDNAGTISCAAGAANFSTGYASEAAAIAALPKTPANQVSLGYITVKTKVGFTFVGGTDGLAGGASGNVASTTNYYDAVVNNEAVVGAAADVLV